MMIFPCKAKIDEFVADIPALQASLQAKMKRTLDNNLKP